MKRLGATTLLTATVAFGISVALAQPAFAAVTITATGSSDPYTNTDSRHGTEVEPDTLAYNGVLVSAYQVGRFSNGGSSNIGWSTFDGTSWQNGFLPSTTVNADPPGTHARATDPAGA